MCVKERERERERESMCECACACRGVARTSCEGMSPLSRSLRGYGEIMRIRARARVNVLRKRIAIHVHALTRMHLRMHL